MTATSARVKVPEDAASDWGTRPVRSASSPPAIRDFPVEERPRERLRSYGPGHLTNSELMAILLRSGLAGENVLAMATRLLARFDGLEGMARAGYDELCATRGVSDAKACQVLAAFELGRRFASLTPADRPAMGSPGDVANMLMAEMSLLEQEHFRVVLLNAKNHVLGVQSVYIGNVDSAVVRPAEVFAEAVRRTCPRVVMVHNHPSGDPTPSPEDIDITRRIIEAGRVLDVEVLDHVIIGRQRFVSMKERGRGFDERWGRCAPAIPSGGGPAAGPRLCRSLGRRCGQREPDRGTQGGFVVAVEGFGPEHFARECVQDDCQVVVGDRRLAGEVQHHVSLEAEHPYLLVRERFHVALFRLERLADGRCVLPEAHAAGDVEELVSGEAVLLQ